MFLGESRRWGGWSCGLAARASFLQVFASAKGFLGAVDARISLERGTEERVTRLVLQQGGQWRGERAEPRAVPLPDGCPSGWSSRQNVTEPALRLGERPNPRGWCRGELRPAAGWID